jgi:hypothetical protein
MMLNLTFTHVGQQLTGAELDDCVNSLPCKLPAELRQHYAITNGGYPSHSYWALNNGCSLQLQRFINIKYPRATERCIVDTYQLLTAKNLLPKNFIPFAIDHGGNYFCINSKGAVIYYAMDVWDEEFDNEQNQYYAQTYLTHSFQAFLAGLTEVDEYFE